MVFFYQRFVNYLQDMALVDIAKQYKYILG